MYEYVYNRLTIRINLEPGVYTSYGDSGEGKSYLANMLKKLARKGYPVNSITYGDDKAGLDIKSIITSKNIKILFIDRFDMFIDDELSSIISQQKDKVILLDLKTNKNKIKLTNYYDIELSNNMIEVSL